MVAIRQIIGMTDNRSTTRRESLLRVFTATLRGYRILQIVLDVLDVRCSIVSINVRGRTDAHQASQPNRRFHTIIDKKE